MNFPTVVFILSCLMAGTTATLDLDFSNLDLKNFQYFKHFPDVMNHAKANILGPIGDHFERKKAVFVYFRNLIVGNPLYEKETRIEFDPNFGEKWKPHFESHYGKKGERLIELLGKGYSPEKLRYHGAIPNDNRLQYHYPPPPRWN